MGLGTNQAIYNTFSKNINVILSQLVSFKLPSSASSSGSLMKHLAQLEAGDILDKRPNRSPRDHDSLIQHFTDDSHQPCRIHQPLLRCPGVPNSSQNQHKCFYVKYVKLCEHRALFCLILLMEDLFYLIEHLPYSSGVFRRDKQSDLLYAQKHQDLTLEPQQQDV